MRSGNQQLRKGKREGPEGADGSTPCNGLFMGPPQTGMKNAMGHRAQKWM